MKIALIGSAPSSSGLAPYWDKTYRDFLEGKEQLYPPLTHGEDKWDIWGCSPGAAGQVGRATRWFEVHRWEPGREWFQPAYIEFVKRFKGPVYTGWPISEIPMCRVYPIALVEEVFSSFFLTSSPALMMALAIIEIEQVRHCRRNPESKLPEFVPEEERTKTDEDDEIGLWGIDMAATEEWAAQRPGCQHFILEALRRYIGVYVPPESCVLRPMPVYGISEWDHNYIKLTARMREMNQRRQTHMQELENAKTNIAAVAGAMDDLNYMVNTWTSPYGLPAGMTLRLKPGTGLGGQVKITSEPDKPT